MRYLPLETLTELELAEVIIRSVYSPVFVIVLSFLDLSHTVLLIDSMGFTLN